ncbi:MULTISPECIES: hypothetical protein [unclassified Mesorhizobium]|uniref:hypothetical protein n=1 Tax=unclassified Mesorhizobium TaxID=325217 RepID=UPI000FD22F1F|nr:MULTISPECIES: hypothetical protein [unclassified Mesorhizobium]RUU47828.1 hypothetical protein EOD08_05000 [Mesorhizobium sp. M6A.T.Ca.TU.002.02.2.1]RVB76101.1 hypothetical protein EN885_17670 [Mesorhizobium sp. M6A.T.Cr.TU.014.01.1.1]RWO95471.1 MAG: hypothetical protein EOQ98_26105 [Mesorhizobium sp.]RWP76922.1 MAG: hypothetical protein EOR10_16800 [Mesorhizobium sp.]RWP99542.1 MAG: hypothetical protein EOR90_24305 [Mesorhizobium sp.]
MMFTAIAMIAAGINLLKRVALKRIQSTRFKPLFLCMSLSQNRCALLGDMHYHADFPPSASSVHPQKTS